MAGSIIAIVKPKRPDWARWQPDFPTTNPVREKPGPVLEIVFVPSENNHSGPRQPYRYYINYITVTSMSRVSRNVRNGFIGSSCRQ
ncbi:hypothetical protein [Ralstonia solanacearum]|uniref:hypothetical protein n=1 Tax=Ralstonia solanacearum TaxID=305 RepID=UPI0012D37AAF|nr:hypothetical protein [Ralstonia solanacearum]